MPVIKIKPGSLARGSRCVRENSNKSVEVLNLLELLRSKTKKRHSSIAPVTKKVQPFHPPNDSKGSRQIK